MSKTKEVSDYIRALYTTGLEYEPWSEDRAQYHTEAMWLFCTQLFPKQFPYKPFHRQWMYVANRYQYFCILAPRSHAKCLPANTPVPTPDGRVVELGSIKPGDKVLGRVGNSVSSKTVLATENVGKKDSLVITLTGGREITSSKDHRFLTWDGWVEAERLSEGDWIAVPRSLPDTNGPETNRDCEFIIAGYLLADGSVGIEKSNGIQRASFSNTNPRLVSDFTSNAEEMGWAVTQRTDNDYYLADNKTGTRTGWLQEWGMAGKLSGDKRIPEQIMMASNRQVALFLSRLYACDGHATLAGGGAIGYCSKNKDMIVDLQGLLLRFGINSAISPTVSRKYGGTYWRLQINGTDIILFADRIGIYGKEQDVAAVRQLMAEREQSDKECIRQLPPEWRKNLKHSPHWFRENYGIRIDTSKYATGHKKVRLVAEIEGNQGLLDSISGDIAWLPIRSIVSGAPAEMVDIQVDGDSSFIASNIITHNSSIIGGLYPLFRIVMNPSSTIMLVASSSSVSELQLRSIRENVETHQGIKEGFGDLYPENPTKWTNTEIIVQRPPGLAHPTVVALGAGNAILSRRAQFIIADDIVRDDETRTVEQRRKLADWVNGVLIGVLEADDQFGVIGTKKHYCLPPDMLVSTPNGFRPIEVIEIGDDVITSAGRSRRVSNKGVRQYDGKLYSIKAAGAVEPIRSTNNHPILTKRGYVRADEVADTDWIGIPATAEPSSSPELPEPELNKDNRERVPGKFKISLSKEQVEKALDEYPTYGDAAKSLEISKTNFARHVWTYDLGGRKQAVVSPDATGDDAFWRLTGWWIAEGDACLTGKNRNRKTVRLTVHQKEIREVTDLLRRVCGNSIGVSINKNTAHITANSSQLYDYWTSNFGRGALNKHIPEWVYGLNRQHKIELLHGYWLGDGSLTGIGYRFSTISPHLAAGVQRLLATLDIVSSGFASREANEKSHKAYEVRMSIRDGNGLFGIQFPVKRQRRFAGEISRGTLWLPVKSIETSDYSGAVHNIQVDDDESFLTIGGITHNSDFYSELEGNDIYHHRVYDSVEKELEDGTWLTIWPEKWPSKKLQERKQALGTFQFNQNYRNIVLSEDDSPFPTVWLEGCKDIGLSMYSDYPYNDLRKVIGVDLAGGKSDDTSYFVATVMGMREDGHFIILNMVRDRMDFPDQVRTIENLIDRFSPGLDAVIVESNAYQSAMTATIQAKFPALNVVAHQTGRNKHSQEEGIPMLQPIIEGRRLHFPYRDSRSRTLMDVVIEEFNRYGVARHSDTVMATWFCVKYLAPLNRNALTRGRAMIL